MAEIKTGSKVLVIRNYSPFTNKNLAPLKRRPMAGWREYSYTQIVGKLNADENNN